MSTPGPEPSGCAAEPIHLSGAIQPHGALIGFTDVEGSAVLASDNVHRILGCTDAPDTLRLDRILDAGALKELRAVLPDDPADANPLEATLDSGARASVLIHRSEGLLIAEIEPQGNDPVEFTLAYRRLVRRFERLRRAATVDEVCELAAHEVRALTGFDRVMVYRFDPHFNGQVVAEAKSESLEPFLGLHYPASDIPPQARRLYTKNPLRLIVDAQYEPVPIQPSVNPLTGGPLDLSHASLRSVSPVHCQYLKNMGVRASMSISLLDGEDLWGLIACHHAQPSHVPYGTRMVAEFLSHVLSARIHELQRVDRLTRKNTAYAAQSRLIDEIVSTSRLQEGLTSRSTKLTDLIDCDGAAIIYQGEVTTLGSTPAPDELRVLAAHIADTAAGDVYATDHLAGLLPQAAGYARDAAGAIAVPMSRDGSDMLLWLRRERLHSITWAGDPAKAYTVDDARMTLTPRASFRAFEQAVTNHSTAWEDWEVEVAADFRTAVAASVIHQAAELERLNSKLVEASQQKDRFLATVSHELRNPLNAIIGWVQVARMGLAEEELAEALDVIESSANAQKTLIDDLLDVTQIAGGRLRLDTGPLKLTELVEGAINTVTPTARTKGITITRHFDADTSDVVGDPGRLRQCVWNLLTNAIKFSPRDGARISVHVTRKDSRIVCEISDNGVGMDAELVPRVFEPFRQGGLGDTRSGLGLGLSIVKSIIELHGGEVSAFSAGPGRGSTFSFAVPVAPLSGALERSAVRAQLGEVSFAGVQVLVVDDQPDASGAIVALLEHTGAIARSAGNGREALEALQQAPACDVIISDLDMPDMDGFAFVAELARDAGLARIPAIALTGYSRGGDRVQALNAGFTHYVSKPVDPAELLAVMTTVIGRRGGG